MPTQKDIENRLELIKFYNDQQDTVRNLIDKWFGNYLLIMGAPIPVLVALANYGVKLESFHDPNYLWLFPLGYFALGLHFFWINTRQRMSAMTYHRRIELLEKSIHTEIMNRPPLHPKPGALGADFWKGGVFAFLNSIWLVLMVFLIIRTLYFNEVIAPGPYQFVQGVLAALTFGLSYCGQLYVRHLRIRWFDLALDNDEIENRRQAAEALIPMLRKIETNIKNSPRSLSTWNKTLDAAEKFLSDNPRDTGELT